MRVVLYTKEKAAMMFLMVKACANIQIEAATLEIGKMANKMDMVCILGK